MLLCRDIKPENIVLEGGNAGGRVRLVDFGGVQAAARNAEGAGGPGTTVIGKDRVLHGALSSRSGSLSNHGANLD